MCQDRLTGVQAVLALRSRHLLAQLDFVSRGSSKAVAAYNPKNPRRTYLGQWDYFLEESCGDLGVSRPLHGTTVAATHFL